MHLEEELTNLEPLALSLLATKDLGEKQELLLANRRVAQALRQEQWRPFLPSKHDLCSKIALFALMAIGQHATVLVWPSGTPPKDKLRLLHAQLAAIDRFYESVGGIVGYQCHVLSALANKGNAQKAAASFSGAEGMDLTCPSRELTDTVWTGVRALKEVAEIYPIGGLGSRLGLTNKKKLPLPAAWLPFRGKSLLEGLIDDVQAKEFLYYRLFGRQITVPIAMMTSQEMNNHEQIKSLCKKNNWFGRPSESFFLFPQLSVPVVTEKGAWSIKAPLELHVQPGGHGALWKAAEEQGVFHWLQGQEKGHLLIRQINNPVAGLDLGLLALIGKGKRERKALGFASCSRAPNAAEGILVLVEENGERRLSNIEYTDFNRYSIESCASCHLANTNILYAHLEQMLPVIKNNPLPQLVLNMKNKEPVVTPEGTRGEILSGRLESMMQNISDSLKARNGEQLATFLTINERKKTLSAAKKSFTEESALLETPEGAFYDLLHCAHELLEKKCGAAIAPFAPRAHYLQEGPSHIFLYHPALGPLYSLISQKIRQPTLELHSELQLEIADIYMNAVSIQGSLLVKAENILGHKSQGLIRYSNKTGKCYLNNVSIINEGASGKQSHPYWQNRIKRNQALTILLLGHSEFLAENVVFKGHHTIIVPDGQRWIASQAADGEIRYQVEKPGWHFNYEEKEGDIKLKISLN